MILWKILLRKLVKVVALPAFLIDESAEGHDVGGTIIPSTFPQAHAPKGGSFHEVAAGLINRTGPDHSGYFVPLPVRQSVP